MWNGIVAAAEDASFLQTWEFGEAKAKIGPWRAERGVLIDGDSFIGAVQVLIRKPIFSRAGLAWVSRGPVGVKGNYGEALFALHQHFSKGGDG